MEDVRPLMKDFSEPPGMRVALITETYPPEINGVAMTIGRMVEGLIARGHRVSLVRPRQREERVSALHHHFEELLVPGLAIPRYDALRFGLPAKGALVRRWSRQRPDIVHVATEGPLGWSAVSAARHLQLPVTSDFHTNFDQYSGHYRLAWLKRPVSTYLRRFHNRAAASYVPSRELAERLCSAGFRGIEVITRGVDCERFAPERRSDELRAAWGLGPQDLAIVCVGRLAPEKNLVLALRGFDAIRRERPSSRLVLVGDGPLRADLQRRHPDTVFAGVRTGEDLAAHYASADLFLFPSRTETFGNVTLEAMASALPVVAFRYAAAGEAIVHGMNGMVEEVGDDDDFVAHALTLARSPSMRLLIGAAARAAARLRDWDNVHDAFAASLRRIALTCRTTGAAT